MTTNLTQGIPPQPYGKGGRKVYLPMSATAQVWQGAMVAQLAGACVTGTTAGAGPCIGVAEADTLGGATNGAVRLVVLTDQIFRFAAGTLAPTDSTPYGTPLFMETDNTVGTGAPGQQPAGRFMGFEDDGYVRVYVSNQASWFDSPVNSNDGGSSAFTARVVITSLGANTGTTTGVLTVTATGALAAQDGVALATGDLVFIQPGTTNLAAASDAGPYVVNVGGTGLHPTFTRPSWWQTAATMLVGQVVHVGGEGTVFRGTAWKNFCAKGKVVDTDDAVWYVGRFVEQTTFAGGDNGAHTYAPSVGILDAVHSAVMANMTAPGGTMTAAVNIYVDAITPGYTGTATMTIQAYSAAFATNSAAGTYKLNVLTVNW
jgi:hypothetical protein